MADFLALISKAVAGLAENTAERRRLVYDKARKSIEAHLQSYTPPIPDEMMERQRAKLEHAIAQVETQFEGVSKAAQKASPAVELEKEIKISLDATALPTTPRRVPGQAQVFISYRRDDARYQARDIYRILTRTMAAERVFMDVDSIRPGENFVRTLEQWVEQCDILLALIGPNWVSARDPKTNANRLENPQDFVRIEIRKALSRNVPVVPVLLDGASLPSREQLPRDLWELVHRNAEFVDFRTFETDVERLMRKLGLFEK